MADRKELNELVIAENPSATLAFSVVVSLLAFPLLVLTRGIAVSDHFSARLVAARCAAARS